MHIHTVFFWLNEGTDENRRQRFEKGLDALTRDPNVLNRRIGTPAQTDRAVIDSSYDYGVSLSFEDLAAHDRFQIGQIHLDFLKNFETMWSRVQVYDMKSIESLTD